MLLRRDCCHADQKAMHPHASRCQQGKNACGQRLCHAPQLSCTAQAARPLRVGAELRGPAAAAVARCAGSRARAWRASSWSATCCRSSREWRPSRRAWARARRSRAPCPRPCARASFRRALGLGPGVCSSCLCTMETERPKGVHFLTYTRSCGGCLNRCPRRGPVLCIGRLLGAGEPLIFVLRAPRGHVQRAERAPGQCQARVRAGKGLRNSHGWRAGIDRADRRPRPDAGFWRPRDPVACPQARRQARPAGQQAWAAAALSCWWFFRALHPPTLI